MNSDKNNSPERQELFDNLAFLGEIMASVTHELNNVLGTIEQVSGLAEDMAATDLAQQVGITERLTDIADRISRQSERGSILIKRLNRLAHLTDEPVTEFDLTDLLENILALSERFAKMRKVSLSIVGLDQKVLLRTNPLLVTQVIYNIFRGVLAGTAPGESLEIRLVAGDAGNEVIFDGVCDSQALEGMASVYQTGRLVADLDGRIEILKDGGRTKVRLQLPAGG